MARRTRKQEVDSLVTAMVDAVAAANTKYDRDIGEAAMRPMAEGIVDWIRAREDDDIEVDLSDVVVSGADLEGTGTIT